MKIAFRHVPFSAEQKAALNELAAQGGYEPVWCEDGSVPTADALSDCEVLMGYFPPDLIRALPALKWVQTPSAGVERLWRFRCCHLRIYAHRPSDADAEYARLYAKPTHPHLEMRGLLPLRFREPDHRCWYG